MPDPISVFPEFVKNQVFPPTIIVALADPIDIVVEVDAVGVVTPAILAVTDPIDIEVEMAPGVSGSSRIPGPPPGPRTREGDHGGQWIGRIGQGQALDRAIILGRGYTILEERESSGLTKFIVHLTLAVLRAELENPLPNGDGLVYQLFPLPEGEIITASLVLRTWPFSPDNLIISS